MFKNISEIKEINSAENIEKAVCAMTGAYGWNVEGFSNGNRAYAFLLSTSSNSEYRAEMTIQQFYSLAKETDWENCGAQSANDSSIVKAALDFLRREELVWQKLKNKKGDLKIIDDLDI